MTETEFEKFIEHLEGLFVAKEASTQVQVSRWKFMLSELDGQPVTYREGMYALRELAADGQKFMPVPGEVLGKVRAQRDSGGVVVLDERAARKRFERIFMATARMYGRDMAVAFHDPHGEFKDWRPQTGGGVPAHPAGRQQLIDLGALKAVKELAA